MHIEWTDDRCILCTLTPTERAARCCRTAKLTKEHIIPEVIGGRLTCNFLCQHCNSLLGQIEALLKDNSGIRLAIDNLKASLPDLWLTMAENQPCIAEGTSERTEGRIKNGTFSVNSSQRPDGSLIQPLTAAAKTVQTSLERRGATQAEITNAATRMENLLEGSRVRIADGIEVLKSMVDVVQPALNSRDIEPRALLKIAYEYAALHVGSKIFDPYFNSVRSALRSDGVFLSNCSVEVKRAQDRRYAPLHGLAVKNDVNGLTVKISSLRILLLPGPFRRRTDKLVQVALLHTLPRQQARNLGSNQISLNPVRTNNRHFHKQKPPAFRWRLKSAKVRSAGQVEHLSHTTHHQLSYSSTPSAFSASTGR